MNKKNDKVAILGVEFTTGSEDKILGQIRKMVDDGRRHYIVTPNPEIVIAARKDNELKHILNGADLAIPDGVGIVWASKILCGADSKIVQRVAGVDLMERICDLAAHRGWSVFFLGAGPTIARQCAQELQERYPGLLVVGAYSGRAERQYDAQVREKILAVAGKTDIDFLFVAYGGGRQEKWIKRNLSKLPVKVAMGVGGSFDFISGQVQRAPLGIQKLGLEWAWRLIHQPWRWRRQLALISFILIVLRTRLISFLLFLAAKGPALCGNADRHES